MLKHGEINAPDVIWNIFKEEFMSDVLYQERRRLGSHLQLDVKKVENESLKVIEDLLQDMDMSLNNISSLPNPEIIQHVPKVIDGDLFDTEEQRRTFIAMEAKLNYGQREIFEVVKDSLYSSDPKQFCINAAAGSGKNFPVSTSLCICQDEWRDLPVYGEYRYCSLEHGEWTHSTFEVQASYSFIR